MNEQLIRYMRERNAQGGILLLGWFASAAWDAKDSRKKNSTKVWDTREAAEKDLDTQVRTAQENDKNVRAVVVNCTLS